MPIGLHHSLVLVSKFLKASVLLSQNTIKPLDEASPSHGKCGV